MHLLAGPKADDTPRTLLNWILGGPLDDFKDPLVDEALLLFDMIPDEAADFFRVNGDPQTIWIDDGKLANGTTSDWIAFRGAFLVEQYQPTTQVPYLRWPLIQECSYYKVKLIYPALMINNRGDNIQQSRFRFNLNMPLPLPDGDVPRGDWRNLSAFPFCAVYPCIGTANALPLAEALVAGWIQGDSTDPEVAGSRKGRWTSYVIHNADKPKSLILGDFGFARRHKRGDRFAAFTGDPKGGQGKHQEFFWPTKLGSTASKILNDYRFAVSTDPDGSQSGPADLSLRFPAWAPDEGERLNYRVRLDAKLVNPADDLKKRRHLHPDSRRRTWRSNRGHEPVRLGGDNGIADRPRCARDGHNESC